MDRCIREYQTIKFFRGSKRNNSEMQRLAEARLDFEYRRLLIKENELDLHVHFSRMTLYGWLSWFFLVLVVACLPFTTISYILLGFALLTRILSFLSKRKFQFVFRSYNLALAIVDGVIFNEHGISLR
jgi:hypothetical protein